MSIRIEEQIRRYTESMDALAPSVEDLLPPGMASELDVEQRPGRIEVVLTDRPSARVPAWALALVAAVAVVLLFLPIWFWLSQPDAEVVATTTTTSTMVEEGRPEAFVAPGVRVDLNGGWIEGTGWTPGAELSIALEGVAAPDGRLTAIADGDGRFRVAGFDVGFDGVLAVTDGVTTVKRRIDYAFTPTRVDPVQDTIAGNAPRPQGDERIVIRVLGPDVLYETSIESAAAWMVDLGGELDLRAGMTVEAVLVDDDPLTLSWTSGMLVHPWFQVFDDGGLVGSGWSVSAPVRFSVNGAAVPEAVATDPSGSFHTSASVLGFRFDTGDVLTVEDGRTVLEVPIVPVVVEAFDPVAGRASGIADLPDGAEIRLDGWPTSATGVVTAGRWDVEFELVPGSPAAGEWWIAAEVGDGGWVAVRAPG